ncbi:MAG: exodeoxyribonuclease V subunit gamma [Burkholderiaceae bacterium]
MDAAGLMVVHGNRPEALRDLLLGWIDAHPLAPLETEVVLVQSNGVAQWLKLALARDRSDGGLGIAAAIDAQLPARFLWQAYRAVLGADRVPSTSPFDERLLTWRLVRLLPALLDRQAFAPLRRFLDGDADLRKRFQLAERLADLLDQYQVYRADWLEDWALGHDRIRTSRRGVVELPDEQRWQPQLWRSLLDDMRPGDAAHSRANVHREFVAAAALAAEHGGARPAGPQGLPRRVLVFGISSLPQQWLEALAALSTWMPVLMCVHNPCEHFWADIVADRDLLRIGRSRQARRGGLPPPVDDDDLHRHAHPLLAAWGRQGRDFIHLLDVHDDRQRYEHRFDELSRRIDLFESSGEATLLQQLQDDIRDLRPLAETRARWPRPDPSRDASIRFHVAHGALREVEILHDQLLDALTRDPTLQPRDIIVMVPDIDAYAPHVQAVFGLPAPGDRRHIPFALTDRGQRHHDPLLGALDKLLELPMSRISAAEVIDLLDVPAVRRRFGIDEARLPLLQRWVAAANVRWGLHAEQRDALSLPGSPEQNSWRFGLERMMLGYAVGDGDAWSDIEPLDEVGGIDAELLGPLMRVIDAIERHWRALREPASPSQWTRRLTALLDDFFAAPDGDDGFTLVRLRKLLADWQAACDEARLTEPVSLAIVRDHWLGQLDAPTLGQPFIGGGVTFATLMPMRAIPFRRVCLLGMNDGDFPRTRIAIDFDLMGSDYRPGDRSRRDDDRYLFLEAVLSARDHLHLSWVGRSIHDNSERPPSVLVAQLRDHLRAGWRIDPAALTVEHPLQPFSRRYFEAGRPPALFSYADDWRAGLQAGIDPPAAGAAATRLAAASLEPPLTLDALRRFVRSPAEAFFRARLRIAFDPVDPAALDHEPFELDALEQWRLQDELIRAQRLAVDRGLPRDEALRDALARIRRRGALLEPMDDLFERYLAAIADWPDAQAPRLVVDPVVRADPGLQLRDWLGDWRRDGGDGLARVLLSSSSLIDKRRSYRREHLLRHWIDHVAAHLAGPPMTTCVIGRNGSATLGPLAADAAARYWSALLDAYADGLREALPLAPRAGFAWLRAGGRPGLPIDADAARKARSAYEGEDGRHGTPGEVRRDPCLARAYPDFDALWADGRFAVWCDRLYAPLDAHLEGGDD